MNSDSDPAAASATAPAAASATAVDGRRPGPRKLISAAAPSGNIWIIDAWRDLLCFVATPLLLIPLVSLLQRQLTTAGLYLAVLTFGAIGHQFPCFLRAYGDRDLFQQYRFRFLMAPVVMLGFGFGFAFAGLDGLSVILLLWGFWHILTQHYGFLRIYDAKVGSFESTTIRLDFFVCFFWFGAGVVYSPERTYQLLDRFYATGGPLLEPTWVNVSQLLWGFLTALVTIAFVMNYIYQRRQGQAASLLKLFTMAAGIGLWWFAMVSVHDLLAGILLFELYHDIQYLALTRHYGCRRGEQGGDMGLLARGLFKPGLIGLALFLVVVLLYGAPAFLAGISPAWLEYSVAQSVSIKTVYALVAASTLLHFYYDSFIWQVRDPVVRRTMDLPTALATTDRAWPLPASVSHSLKWSFFLVPAIWIGYVQWGSTGPAEQVSVNLVEAVPASWEAHARWGAELLEQGRELSDGGQAETADEYLKAAVEQLQEATSLRPDAVAAQCDLGRALRQLRRFTDALEHFEKAAEADSQSAQVQAELGKTLFGLREMDRGREHLLRAATLAPKDASIHYDLALAEARLQNFEEALAAIDNAIELDSSNADAFNARGNIYWNMNDLKQAFPNFDKALELDPQLIKAYRNRAQLWLASGNTQNTIADLNEAIKLDDSVSRDFVIRGDIFYDLKQFDKARADYAEALLREEVHLEPLERMITLLTACPDQSYRDLEQAIVLAHTACRRANFTNPRSLQLLAATCATAGRFDEAIRWQEQAIPLSPQELQEEMRQQVDRFRQAQANQQTDIQQGESDAQGNESTTPDSPAELQQSRYQSVSPRVKGGLS